MKKCISCGEEIHPKRLEILPNATRCVACSTTNKKAGVSVMKGEGDHTYVETIIMERDEFLKYQEAELRARGKRPDDFQHPDDFIKESIAEESNIETIEEEEAPMWDPTLSGNEDEIDFSSEIE
jgi:hypothetical protein